MMRSLYENVHWDKVKFVGFDMDGTLYDEYDFIVQVYKEIATLLDHDSYNYMCQRWLEKGSSFPFIFDETYDLSSSKSLSKDEFISKALNIFRNFKIF